MQIYFHSYSSAIQNAITLTENRGYDIDQNDYHAKVSVGPRKPIIGDTNRVSIDLLENGNPINRQLNIQVYNTGGNKGYELNHYIA